MNSNITLKFSTVFDKKLKTGNINKDTLEVKIAGISFRVNMDNYEGYTLEGGYIEHDLNNKYDPNAIGIYHESGDLIGYVPKKDIDTVNKFTNSQKSPCMIYIAPFIDDEGEFCFRGLARIFRYYDGENSYINDAMNSFFTQYTEMLTEEIEEYRIKIEKKLNPKSIITDDDNNCHITFKNIALGCTLPEFAEQLCNQGYDYHEDYFKGIFAGHKVKILVNTDDYSELVTSVMVIFKERDTWDDIKEMYLKMRELYISKYGEPTEDHQMFLSSYREGDGDELEAIKENRCAYFAEFEIPYGKIAICILQNKVTISYNDVTYIDEDNSDDYDDEFYDDYDIMDDI